MPLTEEAILALTFADSLPAVIARMEQIAAAFPDGDGLSCFNRLYLSVARSIDAALSSDGFADVDFLRRLEVNFANLYFEAVRRAFLPSNKARLGLAWEPLFASRQQGGIAPENFALAGMHAHLNHDLCLAIVRTCEERALTPEKGSPPHLDFQRLSSVWHAQLQATQAQATQAQATQAQAAHPASSDDSATNWSCLEARNLAWDNAEVLWHLRSSAELTADYLSLLERNVVAASRGLLAKAV